MAASTTNRLIGIILYHRIKYRYILYIILHFQPTPKDKKNYRGELMPFIMKHSPSMGRIRPLYYICRSSFVHERESMRGGPSAFHRVAGGLFISSMYEPFFGFVCRSSWSFRESIQLKMLTLTNILNIPFW